MSNRVIVSPTEVLFSSDVLKSNKLPYVGMGRLAQAILGSTTQLNGLPCTPTAPASLAVLVGSGEIYILEPTDPTAYGVLPIDNTNIVKQGILATTQTLSTPAPSGVGNSINYLIQVGFSEVDGGATLRQFYNSANPSSPTFSTVNTERDDNAVVQVKAGVPAPTGTQTTPTPDAGFVGAYVVTVANGQTTVTSGNITVYSGAPFISDKLKDKISQAQGDALYAQLSQFLSSGVANGYIHLPGGLILQWLTFGIPVTSGSTLSTASGTFPIPFVSTPFFVGGNVNRSAGSTRGTNVLTYAWTNTGFTVDLTATAAQPFGGPDTLQTNYLAIGI